MVGELKEELAEEGLVGKLVLDLKDVVLTSWPGSFQRLELCVWVEVVWFLNFFLELGMLLKLL